MLTKQKAAANQATRANPGTKRKRRKACFDLGKRKNIQIGEITRLG